MKEESFRPPSHHAPDTLLGQIIFWGRLLADFQFYTIYSTLKKHIPTFGGKVLDIGCGNCPFEHLVDTNKAQYIGLDVQDADKWDYQNEKIIRYDGEHIPFEAESIDAFICTEVIEHVIDPKNLIADMHRVLKKGGTGIITLPWSARFHYKPYDYHRYTPSMLERLFAQFGTVEIVARGTDINAIVNKSIVLYLGMASSLTKNILFLPIKVLLLIIFFPIIIKLVIWGHLALWFNLGSEDDPLGYTIILRK